MAAPVVLLVVVAEMPGFVQSQSQDLLGGKKVAAGHRQEHSLAHKPIDKAAVAGPLADSRQALDLWFARFVHLAQWREMPLASRLVAEHLVQTHLPLKQMLLVQQRRTSVFLAQQQVG